jgi:hypothetical protein
MKALIRLRAAFARLSTRTQLFGAFGTVLLLTAAVGAIGLGALHRVHGQAGELSDKWLPGVGYLASVKAGVLEVRDQEVRHSRTGDKSYHAEYEAKMADGTKSIAALLADYDKTVAGDDERKLVAALHKNWADYQKSQQRVVELGRGGKQQDAADISDGASSTAADD